jgi:hypothetical protein
VLRIYFAALDADNVGRVGYVELDPKDPTRVLTECEQPVLDVGRPGTFDDSGVTPSAFMEVGGARRLLYIGWQRMQNVPYLLFCGVAAERGDLFERQSDVPLLERTSEEPFIRSATTVLRTAEGWRMWYVSARGWIDWNGAPAPEYVIRCAESRDAQNWIVKPGLTIDFNSPDEFGFGRPWALQDGARTHLWYSIRSRTRPYRIGYAESRDGVTFVRKDDEAGIAASPSGWDSEMICFPAVIDVAGKRLMFYNGNHHGATGFGLAELESD